MRRFIALVALVSILAGLLLLPSCSPSQLSGPYLGQEPPGTTPRRFAANVIRGEVHCSPVFSLDGQEVYWVRMDDDTYRAEMLYSKLVDGRWTQPAVAPFSQKRKDDSPTLSLDGNRLFFNRNDDGKENIYCVERAAGGWAAPVILPSAVNSLIPHWQMSLGPDDSLYFGGRTDPAAIDTNIYVSRVVDGEYMPAEVVGEPISTAQLEDSPFVARDGSYMLLSRGSRSDADLYVSFRKADGSWGEAIRFGAPINAASGHDHCPRVTDDGKYMFWVSTRGGASQPYWVDAGVIEALRPR